MTDHRDSNGTELPNYAKERVKELRRKLDTLLENLSSMDDSLVRAEGKMKRAFKRWSMMQQKYRRMVKQARKLEFELDTLTPRRRKAAE
jgi:chromosome segregation ATPase